MIICILALKFREHIQGKLSITIFAPSTTYKWKTSLSGMITNLFLQRYQCICQSLQYLTWTFLRLFNSYQRRMNEKAKSFSNFCIKWMILENWLITLSLVAGVSQVIMWEAQKQTDREKFGLRDNQAIEIDFSETCWTCWSFWGTF